MTLYEIYNSENPAVFNMAVTYVIDKGLSFTSAITDEQIAALEGNPMMTQDFVQHMVKVARQIATVTENNIFGLINFCANKDREISYDRMSEIASYALDYINENYDMEDFINEFSVDLTYSEADYFCIDMPEEDNDDDFWDDDDEDDDDWDDEDDDDEDDDDWDDEDDDDDFELDYVRFDNED